MRRQRRTTSVAVCVLIVGTLGMDTARRTSASAAAVCTNIDADIVIGPSEKIDTVAQNSPAGTTFRVAAGLRRGEVVRPKAGQKFYGTVAPDCRRLTILDGSRTVANWRASDRFWIANNWRERGGIDGIDCEPRWDRCGHPQDLFANDRPLRHVPTLAQARGAAWHYDYANDRLYIARDPNGVRYELSADRAAFLPTASDVTVSRFVVQKYAAPPSTGAIGNAGSASRWAVSGNEVTLNHGAGIATGGVDWTVEQNYVHDNGQLGIKVRGHRHLVAENVVRANNYAMTLRSYEAGGIKATGSDSTFRRNCIQGNDGNGLWVDVGSARADIDANVVFRNTYQGIFFEISSFGRIANNAVGQNGNANDAWLYGAQIMLSTSSDTVVKANLVEVARGYGHGITIVWQDRGAANRALNNDVYGNDVSYFGERGWSGLKASFTGGDSIYESNTFRANRYHSKDPTPRHFVNRPDSALTLAETVARSQEAGSTLDATLNTRVPLSCAFLAGVVSGATIATANPPAAVTTNT